MKRTEYKEVAWRYLNSSPTGGSVILAHDDASVKEISPGLVSCKYHHFSLNHEIMRERVLSAIDFDDFGIVF